MRKTGQAISILFVCHGNICRSPMAEFVMKDLVKRRGLEQAFHIESAATSSEELGNPVHPGTRRRLAQEGISCAKKTARRIRREDYYQYDILVGMDRQNVKNMLRAFGGDPEHKVHLMMEFAGHDGVDVDDPWYTGNFDETYDDVLEGCLGLLKHLGF